MSHFRKVNVKIWADAKWRKLSDDAKLLFLSVLTHPHMTPYGALAAPVDTIAFQLQWKRDRVCKAMDEVISVDMLHEDRDAGLIIAPNFLQYNRPASSKNVASWFNTWDMLPECPLKAKYFESLRLACESYGKTFLDAFKSFFGSEPPSVKEASKMASSIGSEIASKSDAASHVERREKREEIETERNISSAQPSAEAEADAHKPVPVPEELKGLTEYESDPKLCEFVAKAIPEWTKAYPGVNIASELRRAHIWEQANPAKKKTPKGRPRFLNAWLERAQNRGCQAQQQTRQGTNRTYEQMGNASKFDNMKVTRIGGANGSQGQPGGVAPGNSQKPSSVPEANRGPGPVPGRTTF